jgi:hypothetical protein
MCLKLFNINVLNHNVLLRKRTSVLHHNAFCYINRILKRTNACFVFVRYSDYLIVYYTVV